MCSILEKSDKSYHRVTRHLPRQIKPWEKVMSTQHIRSQLYHEDKNIVNVTGGHHLVPSPPVL